MARLRKWGYAPGGYMSDCHKCGKTHSGMDKRAITCQQCAEDMEEAFEERAAVIQFGSGREDLEKARHLLSLLIESEMVKQDE